MQIELDSLPKLKSVFHQLLSGRHLATDDFDLYHDMQDHETEYECLFAALGYQLRSDQRGFYYMLPESDPVMNVTTRKMSLLVFLLVEHFADEGRDPVTAVTKGEHDLPALAAALWEKDRQLLSEGGLASADAVEKCFASSFVSLGFARIDGNMLRFRPPIARFLDICMELGRSDSPGPEQRAGNTTGEG